MEIAVTFDDLIQFGGAERLLLAIHELYPDAPVYTSLASDEWLQRCSDRKIRLVTSFMQKLPFKKSLNRFYGLLGLHALAFESFKFDEFDVVLSISARFSHGVLTKPGTAHICYMNSPGRMFWEPFDYFELEGFKRNKLLRGVFSLVSTPLLSLLRLWDFSSAQRVDYFIANSRTPQDRIKKYYRRESEIIYPFADLKVSETVGSPASNGGYFLVITRLNAWKRVDVAIGACLKSGIQLKIIGDGPDKRRLKELSGNGENIVFSGYVSEQEKIAAIAGCRALIVTQKEDFGITALEAMSLGKPAIAFKAGGALETVIEGVTGEFFNEQTDECVGQAISGFDPSKYSALDCVNQANKFSRQRFIQELDGFIKNVYHSQNNLL